VQAPDYKSIHLRYNKLMAELMYTEMVNTDLDKYYKVSLPCDLVCLLFLFLLCQMPGVEPQ
jgi:hypothetical protein